MLGRALAPALLAAVACAGTAAGASPPPTTTIAPTTPFAAAPAPAPAAKPAVTFLLSGHGWGHGAGLSQWGARGFALHGWSYGRILARYYRGTTLGKAPVSKVRVLLAENAASLKLASAGGWTAVDAAGEAYDLAPGALVLRKALRIPAVADAPLAPPVSFVPHGAPVSLAGTPYRGSIEVTKTKAGKLLAVNVVGLEDYLRGVVPSEMPSDWPAEALKAQAVAARSYALAQRTSGQPFDLYADTRSQVYGGIAAESSATSAAIAATAGKVVLYKGVVATTFFSSSSGGRTAASVEAFAGKPVPYLVSVPDPYDTSPYRNWGPVAVDGGKVAKALKLSGPVEEIATEKGPSGRVVTATLTTPTDSKDISGGDLRSAFGLRSNWVSSIGVLSLQPAAPSVVFGGSTTLQGRARGVEAPLLEQRVAGGAWTPGPAPAPARDGSFAVAVGPQQTTWYRLASGSVRGSSVKLPVAASVTLGAGLSGIVKPVALAVPVEVQLQTGATWLTVATAPVDAAGAFAAGELGPGTYRARYAPGGGVAVGISAALVVP